MSQYDLPNVKKAIEKAENGLEKENWSNKSVSTDGSVVHYGSEDGKFYAYATWDLMADVIADCKAIREIEAECPDAYKGMGLNMWIMPPFIKLDLESRGVPVDEILKSGSHSELDKYFEDDYREFKLTNLSLKGVRSISTQI